MIVDPPVGKLMVKREAIEVYCIPSEHIERVWPELERLLLGHPDLWDRIHSLPSIRVMLEADIFRVWVAVKDARIKMAVFTQELTFPACKCLAVIWGAGDEMAEYMVLGLSAIEEYAARTGCAYVEVQGRAGWAKALAPIGYAKLHSTFGKRVAQKWAN